MASTAWLDLRDHFYCHGFLQLGHKAVMGASQDVFFDFLKDFRFDRVSGGNSWDRTSSRRSHVTATNHNYAPLEHHIWDPLSRRSEESCLSR